VLQPKGRMAEDSSIASNLSPRPWQDSRMTKKSTPTEIKNWCCLLRDSLDPAFESAGESNAIPQPNCGNFAQIIYQRQRKLIPQVLPILLESISGFAFVLHCFLLAPRMSYLHAFPLPPFHFKRSKANVRFPGV